MSAVTKRCNEFGDTEPGLRIPARYRHDWALFTDWCTATDQPALPADPEALALFLREHPAAVTTQRRRLSAINAVHTDHGYPAPGRTETVRRHLDTARAQRLDRLGRVLVQRAVELPTTGWPSGLFGRRDALLLVLASTGMSFADIARLRRRSIVICNDVLVITTADGHRFRVPPDSETGQNPVVVIYRRWAQVQAFLDLYPGTHLLRHHLTEPTEIITDPLDAEQARQPLLCPIDRWGHLPHGQSMTAQSVSVLVRTYLSGRAPVRKVLPAPPQNDVDAWVEPDIVLDPDYYDRGATARRRDHKALEDLTDVFDELEARADALLEDLMGVLERL
ncbi:hypothetical protein G352_22491 [Rhodococcus ruber BKS 20-38]|uniref:Recombinase n=1 Tax=Rhodococcus ruber BKS 20-38 TaxID=1278076 RepID=M2Z4P8_9NOCA|nr:hypothetical protein [Rhodococcus ruber]EME55838.1 hypothetical protein G352_22491 [Rhodococcus ruber BKS 20-38]